MNQAIDEAQAGPSKPSSTLWVNKPLKEAVSCFYAITISLET